MTLCGRYFEYSKIIDLKGKKVFRYMKAIPTSALCITCHGENISEKRWTKKASCDFVKGERSKTKTQGGSNGF